jgi:Small subunit of serine palmitoyltransferase-like
MANDMRSLYTTSAPSHISPRTPQIADGLISEYTSAMSTSTSLPLSISTIPARQRSGPFKRLFDRVRLEYYRYEVTFGIYVMTPGEKLVANTFVIVSLSLLIWALLLYFPSLFYQKLSRLIWLLTGQSEDVGVVFGMLKMGFRARAGRNF